MSAVLTPEQIEQMLAEHEELWIGAGSGRCGCGAVVGEDREHPLTQTIEAVHRAHVAQVLASLMPQATETVEYKPSDDDRDAWVSSTPWVDHDLHPGEVCLRRTVTSYAPVVGEWTEVSE